MKIKNNNKKYKKKIQWLKDSNPHRKCKPSVIGVVNTVICEIKLSRIKFGLQYMCSTLSIT